MAGLLVSIEYTNATENHFISEEPEHEAFTDKPGELFRWAQKEYGRCTSKVYVDGKGGSDAIPVGWYFQSRQQYEDTGRWGRPAEFYIRGVWVVYRRAEDRKACELCGCEGHGN